MLSGRDRGTQGRGGFSGEGKSLAKLKQREEFQVEGTAWAKASQVAQW